MHYTIEIVRFSWGMLLRPLSCSHLPTVFWTQSTILWGLNLMGCMTLPIAQSACVFSISPCHWKRREKIGLTDSSDSAASWQLLHLHSLKCPVCLCAWTVHYKVHFKYKYYFCISEHFWQIINYDWVQRWVVMALRFEAYLPVALWLRLQHEQYTSFGANRKE